MNRLAPFLTTLVFAAGLARAYDFKALKHQGYVSDFARAIDPASRLELERYCARLEQATGTQIALVTLDSLRGEPIEDVANLLFRTWGVGSKGKDEGLLLLLAIGERRSRLEVGYGLEPVLPDGYDGSLLRQMRPALRQRQYGEALLAAAHALGARIAESKGVKVETGAAGAPRRAQRQEPVPWLVMFGGLGVAFWMLSFASHGRRRGGWGGGFLPGVLLGNLMGGSSYGGRSGGGFGGFDSGDSFGGFGGGDSGGGGASSSW